MDDLDELPRVAIVKMIGAFDETIFRLAAGGGNDFLSVLVKKRRLGATGNGEQRAADVFGVRAAVVAVVFAVLV